MSDLGSWVACIPHSILFLVPPPSFTLILIILIANRNTRDSDNVTLYTICLFICTSLTRINTISIPTHHPCTASKNVQSFKKKFLSNPKPTPIKEQWGSIFMALAFHLTNCLISPFSPL